MEARPGLGGSAGYAGSGGSAPGQISLMLDGLVMDGLEDSEERGFYGLDVELVRRINGKGVYSVGQLAAVIDVDYEIAQRLLCPTYLILVEIKNALPYLQMVQWLGLDLAWLEKKIGKVYRADIRSKQKIKLRKAHVQK